MTLRSKIRRVGRIGDGLSIRTLIEMFIALAFTIALAVSIVANLSTAAAVDHLGKKSDRQSAEILGLQQQAATLATAADKVGTALVNATTTLERRSPTVQFFVCWAARLGDLANTLPRLAKPLTAHQLAVFGLIAANTRTALNPEADGGCVAPALQVTVPPPVTIPPN